MEGEEEGLYDDLDVCPQLTDHSPWTEYHRHTWSPLTAGGPTLLFVSPCLALPSRSVGLMAQKMKLSSQVSW